MSHRRATPRHVRIADTLRSRIRQSAGGPPRRLPSEHALCSEFGVSRMTVRQALDALRLEGLLSRQVGRGTFTTRLGSPADASSGSTHRLRVIGSVDDMLALGDETWFKPLRTGLARAPVDVARALGLAAGAPVTRVTGVRHGDDGPFEHVTVYLRESLGRKLGHEDLTRTSVIGLVERRLGVVAAYVEQTIEVVRCARGIGQLLAVTTGAPVLRFRRTYFTAGGEPIEHAVMVHATARYPYTMMLYRAAR